MTPSRPWQRNSSSGYNSQRALTIPTIGDPPRSWPPVGGDWNGCMPRCSRLRWLPATAGRRLGWVCATRMPASRREGATTHGTNSRSGRLDGLHPTLQPSRVAPRHGGAPPGLVVRYKDAGIPARVVNYAWDELDGIRAELMAWLRHCAVHELATVRVRAAVAVGVLATRSFDMLRADVLYSWASQRNQWLHDAAAIALDTAAEEDPGLLAAVRNLVTAWASEGEQPSLRASSARAWRTLLDEDGTAARHLHLLAATDDVGIIEVICASAAE